MMSSPAPGYVLKNRRTTLERAEKFISPIYFTDCNLFGKLYKKRIPVSNITHYAAPGRIPFSEAVKGNYVPASVGQAFGPTWSTHWFKIEFEIPSDFVGEEVRFHWNSQAECLLWIDGKPVQGLTSEQRRTEYVISPKLSKDQTRFSGYVEFAANHMFGAGDGSQIAPPNLNRSFTLEAADIVVRDNLAFSLYEDVTILIDMVKNIKDENRCYQALYALNEMVNLTVPGKPETYVRPREIAASVFAQKNGDSQHKVYAVGNCHIDSAWLWPYAETIRKCARSFSSTIRLLETNPEFTFACSQAQQFEWVKDHYPELYQEIKHWIKEGRFIPVGGTWVEMDGNIPSGEGFIRQFLYGQQFFEKEFGIRCKEFWLPDTFGYSAQLPQIMQISGIKRFLTQKLSWNLVNKFPHHTFWWEGIDGSKVLAHFPPGESYGMEAKVEEVVKTVNNFADKGRSNSSLYLYGFGDGGQGPTEDMIEKLKRMENCDGLPLVEFSTPDNYFKEVEEKDGRKLCRWTGELYLELHNGTYTSQAQTKKYNRLTEYLLQDVEILSSLALVFSEKFQYPSDELLRLWKLLLLNQFHDVLPGSSIGEVYKDAMEYYEDIVKSGKKLIKEAQDYVFSPVTNGECLVFNNLSWNRKEVVLVPQTAKCNEICTQVDKDGNKLALVEVPSFGYNVLKSPELGKEVHIEKRLLFVGDPVIYMNNGLIEAEIDPRGRLTVLKVFGSDKNAIKPDEFGNQLVIFDDVPLYWDAWDVMDYHMETRKPVLEIIEDAKIVENGPLRATVEVQLKISDVTTVKQFIILDANCPYLKFTTHVDWHESHKFLKVEFPLNVHSQLTTYETQYGYLQRPNHFNTSWDWARFEVCGHKWADISEFDWGVAVLNDSKYGWSSLGSLLRLSLLRSSKSPDAEADMGMQTFTFAVMPHTGTFQSAGVIQAAYELNRPMEVIASVSTTSDSQSYFEVDNKAIILETIKKAESEDKAIILRLYEAFGSRATGTVKINSQIKVQSVVLTNAIEERQSGEAIELKDNVFEIKLTPFQIVTVMLQLA